MLRAPGHESLCAHHLRQAAASQPDAETIASELLDSTGELATANEVNALLANVAKQLARKRIDRKEAVALGYLSQLLLISLPGEKELEAERKALALEELNKNIAEMRARFLASRAARAEEAARKSQNNPSTEAKDSSGPGSQQVSPNTTKALEPSTPRPPITYADVRS